MLEITWQIETAREHARMCPDVTTILWGGQTQLYGEKVCNKGVKSCHDHNENIWLYLRQFYIDFYIDANGRRTVGFIDFFSFIVS